MPLPDEFLPWWIVKMSKTRAREIGTWCLVSVGVLINGVDKRPMRGTLLILFAELTGYIFV